MNDTALLQPQIQTTWMVWLAGIWLLWLPGALLMRLLRIPRSPDVLLNLSLQIGLGLVFWPTMFLWTVKLGWQWSAHSARISLLLLSLIGLIVVMWMDKTQWPMHFVRVRRAGGWLAMFSIVLGLTILTRLLHIRGLVLPNWIDSVHHTMIVRVLLSQGTLPETYAPFIPTVQFAYHWGYHAIIMWLVWLLNWQDPISIAQLILQFGQLLNVLIVLMVYAAGRVLFHSRRAGILAAMLAALVSWFPAYYVAWGRYTQLTGLLVLPAFGIMLWRLHTRPTWGGWLATILLGIGLVLIHVRVAFYAITFATILISVLLAKRAWSTVGLWLITGVAIGLLLWPWLTVLIEHEQPQQTFTSSSFNVDNQNVHQLTYYQVPWDHLSFPHNRELLALATAGVTGLVGWDNMPGWGRIISGLWLFALIGLLMSQLRRRPTVVSIMQSRTIPWLALSLLLGWCTLTAGLVLLTPIGLIGGGQLRWSMSGVIALFLPLSLAGGGLLAWASGLLTPRFLVGPITAFLIIIGSAWGASTMTKIIKPVTVLAKPADIRAMIWIRSNIPSNAYFAINVWPWFWPKYAGTDGGYWISVLTDRQSILPSAFYNSIEMPPELLDIWERTHSLDDPTVRAYLQELGITHFYIGSREGHLAPELLLKCPYVKLIYQEESVYIFTWKGE